MPSIFAQSKPDSQQSLSELSLVQQIEKKVAQSDLKKFRKHIEQARKSHEAKAYQNAISAFQAALKIIPNHPQTLSEIAYSALFHQDYPLSIQSSELGASILKAHHLMIEKDKDLLGSIYFNLGLSYEKQGDMLKASDAYVQSLEYRLNQTVRERLESIDPKKYAAFDSFHAKALKGPFVQQDELCQEIIKNTTTEIEKEKPCQFIILDKHTSIDQPGLLDQMIVQANMANFKNDPNLSLGIMAFQTSDLGGSIDFRFLIKTSKGYYYQNEPISIYNPGAFGIHQYLTLKQIKRFRFFGYENPIFKIQFETNFTDMDMAGAIEHNENHTYLIWCGIGNTMKPSCTKNLEIKESTETVINQIGDEKIDPSEAKPLESWSLIVEEQDQVIQVKQGDLIGIKKLRKQIAFEIGERKLIFE